MIENRKTQYTENAIQKAYITLLLADPDRKITVRELCETADINRGTFYLHYQDIPALQQKLEREAVQKFTQLLPTAAILEDPNGQYIVRLVKEILLIFEAQPEIVCLLVNKNASPDARTEVVARAQRLASRRWMELGLTPQQTHWIFLVMLGGFFELYREAARNGLDWDIDSIAATVGKMFAQGLMSFFKDKGCAEAGTVFAKDR